MLLSWFLILQANALPSPQITSLVKYEFSNFVHRLIGGTPAYEKAQFIRDIGVLQEKIIRKAVMKFRESFISWIVPEEYARKIFWVVLQDYVYAACTSYLQNDASIEHKITAEIMHDLVSYSFGVQEGGIRSLGGEIRARGAKVGDRVAIDGANVYCKDLIDRPHATAGKMGWYDDYVVYLAKQHICSIKNLEDDDFKAPIGDSVKSKIFRKFKIFYCPKIN